MGAWRVRADRIVEATRSGTRASERAHDAALEAARHASTVTVEQMKVGVAALFTEDGVSLSAALRAMGFEVNQ